jgi:LytR cell envelope-related transcriptional attenuator
VSHTGPPPSPPNWGPPGGPTPPLPDGGPDPVGYDTEPVLSWQDPYAQEPPTTPHNPYLTPEDTFPTSSPYAQPVDPVAYAAEHEDARGAQPPAGSGGGGGGGSRAGGTHRARRSPMRYVLPALLGALVLVLIGIGMAGWLSNSPDDQAAPGQSQVHVSTPATSASAPAASTPTPSVSVSTSQTPTAAPTASATQKPRPTATRPAAPPAVHAPAIVLNETTQHGLAADVAQHLRSLGWTVSGVGNWRGNISTTTVYYSPGLLAAARRMAYDLGVTRIRPAVPGMLSNHVTVVLHSDPLN